MKLIFPEGIYYRCIRCGECCRRNWQLCVEEEKRKSLEDFAKTRNIEQPLLTHPASKNLVIRTGEKGGCVFLKPDNLCMIHEQLGMNAKPSMCQTFPVKSVKRPDGYFIRISFACRAVRKNIGLPINSYSEGITNFIEKGIYAGEIKYPIPWGFGAISSEQLSPTIDEPTAEHLLQNFLLRELKVTGIANNYFLKVWNTLWKIFYEALKEKKEKITTELIEKNLQEKPETTNFNISKIKRNMLYAVFLGYELVGREEKNPFIKYKNLFNLIRNRGVVISKYGNLKLQLVEKISFDHTESKIQELLKRYFGHIIESNWLLTSSKSEMWRPTIINSWGLLSLFYGLTVWFSKMFAYTRKSDSVELEDLENAIAIVDIEYVSHISWEWLFLDRPIFAKIFEQLSNTPSFVPTIL